MSIQVDFHVCIYEFTKNIKSEMKENIIIYNPSSGNGQSIKKKRKILKLLDNNEIKYDLFITKNEEELRELAKNAVNNYKNIIGVGGDTTYTIIAEELIRFSDIDNHIPTLAMIGTGSANDIIKSVGMYPIERAVKAIKNNDINYLDIGKIKINSELKEYVFLGSMSIGLGTSVNKYVDIYNKKYNTLSKISGFQFLTGFFAVKRSFNNKDIPVSVIIEYNNKIIKEKISLFVILNTPLYSNGIRFIDNCSPYDGKLNGVIINTKTFFETLLFYSRLEKNKKKLKNFESEKINLKFDKPIDIQLDGEIFNKIKEVEISIIPKRLKVIIPDS